MSNPFDDAKLCGGRSALVAMESDDYGRFKFIISAQYTRDAFNNIQVGDLVAVENYRELDDGHKSYSVISLTQVLPQHFAAQGSGAYPGHIFESMRSIKDDWESQKDCPQYATTTIVCLGVATGWQFGYDPSMNKYPTLDEDDGLPMVGAEVRPLSEGMIERIINQGLEPSNTPLVHKKFTKIRVALERKALFTTHFGIFGFTNTGKSNLLSSLVSDFITTEKTNVLHSPNIIIIDPNDEYMGLLIDLINANPQMFRYIHVGLDSLPLTVARKLREQDTKLNKGDLELLFRQMKLPSELKTDENLHERLIKALNAVAFRTKVMLPVVNMASWIRDEISNQTEPRSGTATKEALREVTDAWCEPFNDVSVSIKAIEDAKELSERLGSPIHKPINNLPKEQQETARAVVRRVLNAMDRLLDGLNDIPSTAIMPMSQLIVELNSKDSRQVTIITGRRDRDIKTLTSVLVNELYDYRRKQGLDSPMTITVLDEADLFIPNDSKDDLTERMKESCITIARRGRKFGLGIGIATQRAALLDTQVMGNLHTYFISKLPRKYDREKVAEAFGIGEDQLSPTFTFRPGNWLVISHDATGLRGVPIPIKADNANIRIRNTLQEHIDVGSLEVL